MKRTHELLQEITALTTLMETKYPELYQFLDENPVTIPNLAHPDLNTQVFATYLEALKSQLQNHIESHIKK